MKLLFDQNLSPKLADCFQVDFDNVVHLCDLGFEAAEDIFVWKYAKSNNFTIVTKDSDFNHYNHSSRLFVPQRFHRIPGSCLPTLPAHC